jgi:hypothetical protein
MTTLLLLRFFLKNKLSIKIAQQCKYLFLVLIAMLVSFSATPQVNADFTTLSTPYGCGSLVVEFLDLSTGSALWYQHVLLSPRQLSSFAPRAPVRGANSGALPRLLPVTSPLLRPPPPSFIATCLNYVTPLTPQICASVRIISAASPRGQQRGCWSARSSSHLHALLLLHAPVRSIWFSLSTRPALLARSTTTR